MDDHDRRLHVAELLRLQALAEPFYGVLMERLAEDIVAGAPSWRPLAVIADLPVSENLPLRLMGAAHRVALAGDAPDYAAHLPTSGGDGDADAAWPAFRALCVDGALDAGVLQPVQTNEPTRAAALLPAFGQIAGETGLPLRLLELGSSAGLLLRFDRYRFQIGGETWGDPASPVRLTCDGSAPLHPFEVASRRGCDPRPLDPASDRLLLLSFVWPTRVERFRAVEAALTLAANDPVRIDRSGAAPWLAEQLAQPVEGVATVVFHSVVWQYLGAEEQQATSATIHEAGRRATASAPVAWLRLEPHRRIEVGAELRLTVWPGGEDRSIGLSGYHGEWLRWGPAPD